MIFIFLSWLEKAHENKEFRRENSKLCRESRPVKLNPAVMIVESVKKNQIFIGMKLW